MVNKPKSLLTPTQSIEFLGFLINSLELRLTLPSEKARKIQQDAVKLLQHQVLTARELAIFIGKITATSRALWQAPLHYRALQRALNGRGQEQSDRYTTQQLNEERPSMVGCTVHENQHRGKLVIYGGTVSYQLPRAISCLPSPQDLCK